MLLVASFAPGSVARANPTTDKLSECLNIGGALVDGMEAGVTAAVKIAEALADPVNAACMGEASAGNPVTIGFMAAMTGIFVAVTADGEQPFHNADQCNQAIKDTLAGLIAEALNGLLNSGLAGDILKSILPDAAVDLIQEVASQVATGVSAQMADALIAALGPVGHYLQCGCAAAGVAAIVYDGAKDVAAAAEKGAKAASACGDLLEDLWNDPKGFAVALIDDPGAVVTAVVDAMCGLHESTEAVCAAAGAVWAAAGEVCEQTGVCHAATAFYEGLSDVGEAISCFFTGCSEPYQPYVPPPCTEGQNIGTLIAACACTGERMGKATAVQLVSSSLYNTQVLKEVTICRTCLPHESSVNGHCVTCPLGFQQDPATGQCTRPLLCPAGAVIKPDNTGCMACPSGTRLGTDGRCTPDCSASPWLSLKPGYSDPPPGYYQSAMPAGLSIAPWGGGTCSCPEGQYNNGSACAAVMTCPDYTEANYATGTCDPLCADPKTIWDTTFEIASCRSCPDGRVAINNTCVDPCGSGEIRSGNQCIACPTGTAASDSTNPLGESLTCSPVCRPGSTYVAPATPPGVAGMDLTPGSFSGSGFPSLTVMTEPSGLRKTAQQILAGASVSPGMPQPNAANFGAGLRIGMAPGAAGAGPRTAGGPTNPSCRPCAANERYVTQTTVTAAGNGITQGACVPCPKGQVASRNHGACVADVAGLLVSLRGSAPRQPPATTLRERQEPQPPRQPPGSSRAPATEPARPLQCPPGRVPNASRTACIVDLGDFGTPGSGLNAPAAPGSTTTPRR
jgi:hypothetical protein